MGNVLVVQSLVFFVGTKTEDFGTTAKQSVIQEANSPVLLLALPGRQVQRASSSSLLSFTLPPPHLSVLACRWLLAETAAWTDSRWAKEEAGLSFIQTLLWIAAGGWCIQIPQTLTGLFSWWRPWGEGDGNKNYVLFHHKPWGQPVLNKCVSNSQQRQGWIWAFTALRRWSSLLLYTMFINRNDACSDLLLSPVGATCQV